MKDKALKLVEMEATLTLGGAGKGIVRREGNVVSGEREGDRVYMCTICYSAVRYT